MYDLTDLTKWQRIGTAGIEFKSDKPRKVRLELLADEHCRVGVVPAGEKHPFTIGVVYGYEVIAFQVNGPFKLVADGNGVVVWTPELETTGAVEIPDAIPFTTIMNRRERNPELELMMRKVNQNVERRMRLLERDMILPLLEERRLNDIKRRRDQAERETAEQEAKLVESVDDAGEDEPAEADADSGDGLQNRRVVAGRPKMAARKAASG